MRQILRYYPIFIVLFLRPGINTAQSIQGQVVDQTGLPLEFVAIAAINPADSILVAYTTSDKHGQFTLDEIPTGKYLVQAHLVGFNVFQQSITMSDSPLTLEKIVLVNGDNQLDEIVLKTIVPISIKEDTVAYNSRAFKVRVEDNTEDLLKKLPGIEIDAAGNITAHGEEVTKIYVDGKEYFGNDPKIATKNLSADAIAKIEVIDENSERARVTGVKDSERTKVINLQLKDDKKVNDFGTAQGGYGTDDRFLTSANYNRFSPKMQFSVFGRYNNINSTGSDISEIMDFSKSGRQSSGGSNNDPSFGFLTTGIIGLHTAYEFKKDQNLNADYFYNYTKDDSGLIETSRVEFINEQEIRTEIVGKSEDMTNSHKGNFNYRDRSKKLSFFNLRGGVNFDDSESVGTEFLEKYNGAGELDLESVGISKSMGNNNSGNLSLNFVRRFNAQSKRNIAVRGSFSAKNSHRDSQNIQENTYDISNPDETFETDILIAKKSFGRDHNYMIRAQYNEPLTEYHFIEVQANYSKRVEYDDVDQKNIENDIVINPLIYEQNYANDNLEGGIFYNYNKDDLVFNTGFSVSNQSQNIGLVNEVQYNNDYTAFNPSLFFRYRPKKGRMIMLRAVKTLDLPSSSELSPAINNFNPLFIKQGNPDLTPEDDYSFFALYNNYNFTSGFNYRIRINYDYSDNAIVSAQFTDSLGIRTSTFENSGNKDAFKANLRFGKTLKKLAVRFNINLNGGWQTYQAIINEAVNQTKTTNGAIGFFFENAVKNKIDASIGADFSKDFTTFTTGKTTEREFFLQSYFAKVDWNITNKLNFNSQFKYDIYEDSSFDSDQSIPIWNASVSYAFNQNNSFNLKFSALDILNKSIGLIRRSNTNYYEEINREVLGNYYMLSLTYLLNAQNQNKQKKDRERRTVQ